VVHKDSERYTRKFLRWYWYMIGANISMCDPVPSTNIRRSGVEDGTGERNGTGSPFDQ